MWASLSGVTKSSAIRGVPVLHCARHLVSARKAFASDPGARVVKYSKEDIVQVHAKLRFFDTHRPAGRRGKFSTSPPGTGNSGSSTGRTTSATCIPRSQASKANLNLITARPGMCTRFSWPKISGDPNAQPDLKLFVEPKGRNLRRQPAFAAMSGPPTRRRTRRSWRDVHQADRRSDPRRRGARRGKEVNQFRSSYATKLRFDYVLDAKSGREPFSGFRDLSRRRVHLHPLRGPREGPHSTRSRTASQNIISFQLEKRRGISFRRSLTRVIWQLARKKLNFSRQVAGK